MNLATFFDELTAQGIELWPDGDQLRYRAPEGSLSPGLLTTLKQHKIEIMDLLSHGSETHPLSYGQQALWFEYQYAPESPAYNVSFAARIHSAVDVPALQRSFQMLVNRHPALRTTFEIAEDQPRQRVYRYRKAVLTEIDTGNWSWETLNAQVLASHETPFDLANGPLIRMSLFTRRPDNHVLIFSLHHLVIDGWSIGLILDELRTLYPAAITGTAPALSQLNGSYVDYVNWQTDILKTEGEQLWAYWREQLGGELPVLNLPADRPHPAIRTGQGDSQPVEVPDNLTTQLRELARNEGVTLYMLLLTAFQLLLHRYSGQEDILISSPMAGRNRPEFTNLVGYFVSPVVIRANLSDNPTFRALLQQVRHTVLAALDHQDYPFPLLVEQLQPVRDPSRPPIYHAVFSLQKQHQFKDLFGQAISPAEDTSRMIDWGGLLLSPFELRQNEGMFDLFLELSDHPASLVGAIKYASDLFDAATIQRMVEHFQILLTGIVANPQQRISDLPLLTEIDRRQMLVEWNNTQADYPKDKCIHQLFEIQAASTPEAVALIFDNDQMTTPNDEVPLSSQSITYHELNARANQLAYSLQALGVGPETLVGICVERSIEMVIGLLGILKAGGAYVPLDPTYPRERLAYVLSDSQAKVLVSQKALAGQLPVYEGELVYLEDVQSLSSAASENPKTEVGSNNLTYLLYTSGSTGRPKGAETTHRNVVNRLYWMWRTFPFEANEVCCHKTALSFGDSAWEIFGPLLRGISAVIIPDAAVKNPQEFIQILAQKNVSRLVLVPSLLRALLDSFPDLGRRLPKLRYWTCSGEALTTEMSERFRQIMPDSRLLNLYGASEVQADATWYDTSSPAYARHQLRPGVPIGRPIANTQIYIVDQYILPVAIGIPGELLVGGDGLVRGYHNQTALTQEKFITNPFGEGRLYRTGDRARYLPDGNIEFLGRADYQVQVRGFRIELGEIETVLSHHPDVHQAVVIVREEQPGDKRLVAYLVPETTAKDVQLAARVRRDLQAKLPAYMVPATFVMLDALPLTPSGKVDRRSLPTPMERGQLDTAYVMPQTEAERRIAAVWQEVLHLDKVGIHDNFFDLGGHSLLIVQVYSRLQPFWGENLAMVDLFRYSTIQSLAEYLSRQASDRPAATLQDQVKDREARQSSRKQRRQIRQQAKSRETP
ncbi:MAG: amino acid adenylation domain-containing protein [Anaerolineae bacterium]|nr:amino acid adenylation domain-containing protein [Anaerolineae bacterium]